MLHCALFKTTTIYLYQLERKQMDRVDSIWHSHALMVHACTATAIVRVRAFGMKCGNVKIFRFIDQKLHIHARMRCSWLWMRVWYEARVRERSSNPVSCDDAASRNLYFDSVCWAHISESCRIFIVFLCVEIFSAQFGRKQNNVAMHENVRVHGRPLFSKRTSPYMPSLFRRKTSLFY